MLFSSILTIERGAEFLKGIMDGQDLLNISAAHPLMETVQMKSV
jgi:hypothetical protein